MILIFSLIVISIIIIVFIKNKSNRNDYYRFINLEEIDNMPGIQFEYYTCEILKNEGYKAKVTPGSNDFGVDIIAEKDGVKIAVQVKRYSSKVPRTAISDAVAGMKHYNCTEAMVLTNNYFSDGALALAKSNNCELIDRDVLSKWIYNFKKENAQFTSTKITKNLQPVNSLNVFETKLQHSNKIDLKVEYKRLENQIRDLEDDISNLESEVWDLKYDIKSIKSDIKDNEKEANRLKREIASLKSEYGPDEEFYDKSEVTPLEAELQKSYEEIEYNKNLLKDEEGLLNSKKMQLENLRNSLEKLNIQYSKIEDHLYK